MTKKHYEAIASMFKPYMVHPTQNVAKPLAKDLADYFEQDNPLFQRAKFLEACGIECDGKHKSIDAIVHCSHCAKTIDELSQD